jgi:hypothetical protein
MTGASAESKASIESIRVVVRIRPDKNPQRCVIATGSDSLALVPCPTSGDDADHRQSSKARKIEPKKYQFGQVFDPGVQPEVLHNPHPYSQFCLTHIRYFRLNTGF